MRGIQHPGQKQRERKAQVRGQFLGRHVRRLEFDTLDPNQGLTEVDTGRAELLYEPLVKLDKDAKNEFMLAESITTHNGSLSEWVIKLRPGVTWHSGKDFTADDVIFTLRRIIPNDVQRDQLARPGRRQGRQGARQAHRPGAR